MKLKSGLYGYLGNHEGFVGGVYLCEMPSLDMYKAVMESIIDRLNKYETAVEGYDNFTVSWHLWGGIGFSLHGIKEDWAPKDLIYFRYVQDTVKMPSLRSNRLFFHCRKMPGVFCLTSKSGTQDSPDMKTPLMPTQ